MNKFEKFTGVAVPMHQPNIDTDQIIPKQFLKSIKRTGFGPFLFDKWRYLDEGHPEQDCSNRPLNPDFVLNQARYAGASILVAGRNFGCGSSREHAPWALKEYGFRVIIASSFADIFYNNCFKNGVLPIVLSESVVQRLWSAIEQNSDYRIAVNLDQQYISSSCASVVETFEVDALRKKALLAGQDEIATTLQYANDIAAYEQKRRAVSPWLFRD